MLSPSERVPTRGLARRLVGPTRSARTSIASKPICARLAAAGSLGNPAQLSCPLVSEVPGLRQEFISRHSHARIVLVRDVRRKEPWGIIFLEVPDPIVRARESNNDAGTPDFNIE